MGVYIPNMEKPKTCGECKFFRESWINGSVAWCVLAEKHITFIGEVEDFCPLIEIDLVRCGECKHSKVYTLQSDAPMKRWCHKGHFPKEVTDGYFCGDGERRADED